MYEDSSSDKPRNSAVEPTFQPFFSKLFCFRLFIIMRKDMSDMTYCQYNKFRRLTSLTSQSRTGKPNLPEKISGQACVNTSPI
jgi:hypothetical protein